MNLSKKLILTSIAPMMIVFLSGGFAVWQTNRILKEFAVAGDIYNTNARMAYEMQVDFKGQVQEWKDVLLRGNNPAELSKHWTEFLGKEQEIDKEGAALVIRLGNSEAASLVQDFLGSHRKLGDAYRRSLNVFVASHYDIHHADNIIKGIDRKQAEKLDAAVELISKESDAYTQKVMNDAWRVAMFNFFGMIFTSIFSSIIFRRSLQKHVLAPITLLSDFARKFGEGDHSKRIDFKSGDELGTLTETFNQASEKIDSLIADLETSNLRFRNLIQGIDAIIWEFDPGSKRYTFVSQHAEKLLGYPLSMWNSVPGFLEKYCHPDDLAVCQGRILETLRGEATGEYTFRAVAANGSVVWFNNRTKLIRDEFGKEDSILGIMIDITRMKQYEDRMAYLSSHDELTGLANRNLLVDRLERAIAHARGMRDTTSLLQGKSITMKIAAFQAKGAGNMSALLLVNMDRFKLINESLGHRLGDEVIKSIAQRLQKIIGIDDTLARLGADEFAIVLRDISKPEDVAEAAREILRSVALPLEIEGNSLVTNCTIGISMYPKDGDSASDMLRNAGSALTKVKQTERNNFKFYTEEMNATALASLQLENKMRAALDNREFVLHYQPQISVAANRMIGVEALIRWTPPGETMISPASFIALAEETNLILPMGEWVLREACRQNKAWQDQGLAPFCVAVNLAASQFAQPDIIELVAQVLVETGLEPRYLELEITESVMMHDVELVIKNLEALHRLGVKLAIDDFGTGYSSLSYLKRLPIDKLKVDRSFVQDISADSGDAAIVAAIIAMAHNLKMTVVAEGVETETQLRFLCDRNCDEIQGYFYSKPLPSDLLENYLSGSGLLAGQQLSTTGAELIAAT